jgi:Nucleotide modification associated domain 3
VKLILSRKGFDSANGGVPSPIFPDGSLCPLPIPHGESPIPFGSIRWNARSIGPIVEALSHFRPRERAHLDPDLRRDALARANGWRPIFGQRGQSQSHLERNGVGAEGDLFLFFGWFRRVEPHAQGWRYVRGAPDLHVIFGWLQIEAAYPVDSKLEGRIPWAAYHPHFHLHIPNANNTLYTARDRLSLNGRQLQIPGGGVFPVYRETMRLTAPGRTRRYWRLPRWFCHPEAGKRLSYNRRRGNWSAMRDGNVVLRAAAIGQEFVLDCDNYSEIFGWLAQLFAQAFPQAAPYLPHSRSGQ